MKKATKILSALLVTSMALTACSSGKTATTENNTTPAETEFEPQLDTEKAVNLSASVFFGNFEAFDQVINHFNEYYPNVNITYEMVSNNSYEFLDSNSVDIFMTSAEKAYPTDYCVDLLSEGIDVSCIDEELLESNIVDGKLLSIPMGLKLHGLVINKTLLENEGLKIPETWDEFMDVCGMLKKKGYTPIQGPNSAFGNLCSDMAMIMLNKDENISKAVENKDITGAAPLEAAYDKIIDLLVDGYISTDVNAEYPDDNYDGAILKFFEGDVPFWVCDTEKVSGMKKRESKSETFSANPFEYEFIFSPLGDNGVYEYIEPWYGFSVNKNSSNLDYAIEFVRFMARQDELNTLASVKGVPSITKESSDERYIGLDNIEKVQDSDIFDGKIYGYVGVAFRDSVTDMLNGDATGSEEALEDFLSRCDKISS